MPHFPKSYDVGANCELILWMTKFKGSGEANNDIAPPLTLRAIYTLPLVGRGMQTGVLDIIEDRLSEARQAKNSRNNNYITLTKLQKAKEAIGNFKGSIASVDKAYSMTDLFVKQYWFPGNSPNTLLGNVLEALYDADIYFPPNHPGPNLNAVKNLIDPDTANKLLWNFPFPDPVTLENKTLGDMTFEQVFQSELTYLYKYYRDTFTAIQAAKEHGILRSHPSKPPKGEPDTNLTPAERLALGLPSVEVANNGKCCVAGKCEARPDHYCKSTTGLEGDPCNSMSDACAVLSAEVS